MNQPRSTASGALGCQGGASPCCQAAALLRHTLAADREPAPIVYLHAPEPYRVEVEGVAGVVLYRALPAPCANAMFGPFAPEARHLVLERLSIQGSAATASIRDVVQGTHGAVGLLPPKQLRLRRTGDVWRVTAIDPEPLSR